MLRYCLLGMLTVGSGCAATIEQLPSTVGPGPALGTGRAFFLQRSGMGSSVLVCDAQNNAVYCCASSAPSGGNP